MDWKDFLIGVGSIAVGYWVYKDDKKRSLSKDKLSDTSYRRKWSVVITFIIVGIYFIISSFQS